MKRIDPAVALRMFVDAILLMASLVLAYVLRYAYAITFEHTATVAEELFAQYVRHFLIYLPLITLLGLSSFGYFGLYSRTRGYNWRGKALTVLKAVTIPYLLVPLVLFLIPGVPILPRTVLFLSWAIATVTVLAARLWSLVWRRVVIHETATHPHPVPDARNVLLIGGAGYIGSSLLPLLLKEGYRVRLLDVFLYGRDPIREWLDHPNLEIVEGDFRQVEKVVSCMREVATVIHLGGIVGDPACALDEQLTIEINLVATRMIAEVAKGAGVKRLIFASTCSVYGASDNILDEQSALNPVSLYARSKIASEKVLLANRDESFSPVILRFGTIFGFSGRTRFDLVVNLLSAKAVVDGCITLYGGDQWRPFVHVDDAARSVMSVLNASVPQTDGEIFNVGSNQMNYTLRQVGEIIQRMVPTSQLLDHGANADRRNYRVNFDKIRRELGFQPTWKLEEGITQVIEAIRNKQVIDYTLPAYSNVKYLDEERVRELGKSSGWEKKVLESVTPFEPTGTM